MAARAPPGPRMPLLDLPRIYRDPLTAFVGYVREHGNVVHLPFGPIHAYLLNEPEAIREVLVAKHRSFQKGRALHSARRLLGRGLLTAEGEEHRSHRRALQPVFHHERIAGYCATMVRYTARTRDRWRHGQRVDAHEAMMDLTLGIIGQALFDLDLEGEPEFRAALSVSVDNFNQLVAPFAAFVQRLPIPSSNRFRHAQRVMDERIHRLIEERRANPKGRDDLLSWVLEAEDAEGGHARLTDAQVRDEAVTIFLAGHETTASGLTWTWYMLSQNPPVEAKLHAELDAVLGGRLPTIEDVPKLRYTRMVFAEGMRMFPPAWIIGRRALEPVEVMGYRIPKGGLCLMSQYMMHRDPRFYPQPEKFDPERWQPEAAAARPKHAYFPFGGGPRVCIGEPFAWMEAIVILATIGQKWRLRLAPDARVEPMAQLTLRPRHGLPMVAETRD